MTLRNLGVVLAGVLYGGATTALVLTVMLVADLPAIIAVAWAFPAGVVVGVVSGVVVGRA